MNVEIVIGLNRNVFTEERANRNDISFVCPDEYFFVDQDVEGPLNQEIVPGSGSVCR